MKKNLIFFIFFLFLVSGYPQTTFRKVLFLGNSYTYVKNLPLLVAALAQSAGDSLIFDDNCPGGYTLGWQPIAHASDPVSLGKISSSNWDFIVLQEQSQIPSIPALRDSCMKPASLVLRDSMLANNPCSRLLFYLTWGRRFGGMQCFVPNYCSAAFSGFDQMQDSLTRSYKLTAGLTGGWIAPVGETWRFVLHNSSMVLHADDFSHPNLNGSYLAACVFYTSIFHKPSSGLNFTAGLLPDSALFLQNAADSIVFGYAGAWNLWNTDPIASFTTNIHADTMTTENQSSNAANWHWNFGDGSTSGDFEPVHIYSSPGDYQVSLIACDSCRCDSSFTNVTICISGKQEQSATPSIRLSRSGTGLLHVNEVLHEGLFQLYDYSGKLIYEGILKKNHKLTLSIPQELCLWIYFPKGKNTEKGKI